MSRIAEIGGTGFSNGSSQRVERFTPEATASLKGKVQRLTTLTGETCREVEATLPPDVNLARDFYRTHLGRTPGDRLMYRLRRMSTMRSEVGLPHHDSFIDLAQEPEVIAEAWESYADRVSRTIQGARVVVGNPFDYIRLGFDPERSFAWCLPRGEQVYTRSGIYVQKRDIGGGSSFIHLSSHGNFPGSGNIDGKSIWLVPLIVPASLTSRR